MVTPAPHIAHEWDKTQAKKRGGDRLHFSLDFDDGERRLTQSPSTELTPETIQPVIRKMTSNFSLAFMTTVVGLPVSAVLRSLIVVTHARQRSCATAWALPSRKGQRP